MTSTTFSKIIKSLALLLVLATFSPTLFPKNPLSWYQSFYCELVNQETESYHLFQIWVTPGQELGLSPAPIGGSLEAEERWRANIEELMQSFEHYHEYLWPGELCYEIYVDRGVYEAHKELQELWAQRYGQRIRWVLIEDCQKNASEAAAIGFELCHNGVAAICSDFLRWRILCDSPYQSSMYIDIDTLSHLLDKKSLPSSAVFGMGYMAQGAAIPCYQPPFDKQKGLTWNNDLLVMHKEDPQKKAFQTALMDYELQQQYGAFADLAQHYQRLRWQDITEYFDDLHARVLFYQTHPEQNISRYSLILKGIGANYGVRLVQRHRAGLNLLGKDYATETLSWLSSGVAREYSYQSAELLSERYTDQETRFLIEISLINHDRALFQKYRPHWATQIDGYLNEVFLENESLMSTLHAEFSWVKELFQEIVGRPIRTDY